MLRHANHNKMTLLKIGSLWGYDTSYVYSVWWRFSYPSKWAWHWVLIRNRCIITHCHNIQCVHVITIIWECIAYSRWLTVCRFIRANVLNYGLHLRNTKHFQSHMNILFQKSTTTAWLKSQILPHRPWHLVFLKSIFPWHKWGSSTYYDNEE